MTAQDHKVASMTIDGDGVLTGTTILLDKQPNVPGAVAFSNVPQEYVAPEDQDPRAFCSYTMTEAVWKDMGEPDQITVHVVPGDTLNV
jgi:hypothetical protein